MKIENIKTKAPRKNNKIINEGGSSSAGVPLNFAFPFCTMVIVVNLFEWGIVCKPLNKNNERTCFKKYDIFDRYYVALMNLKGNTEWNEVMVRSATK